MSPSPFNPQPPIPPPNSYNPAPSHTPDERNWAVGCHLASLSGYIGMPFGHILGPLIIWLVKKDSSAFLDGVGKETVNYNISIVLWFILCIPLMFILIGFFLFGALAITDIVVTLIAAQAASRGETYRYPLTIRFIS